MSLTSYLAETAVTDSKEVLFHRAVMPADKYPEYHKQVIERHEAAIIAKAEMLEHMLGLN